MVHYYKTKQYNSGKADKAFQCKWVWRFLRWKRETGEKKKILFNRQQHFCSHSLTADLSRHRTLSVAWHDKSDGRVTWSVYRCRLGDLRLPTQRGVTSAGFIYRNGINTCNCPPYKHVHARSHTCTQYLLALKPNCERVNGVPPCDERSHDVAKQCSCRWRCSLMLLPTVSTTN